MTADTGLSLAMKLPLRNSPTRYHFQGPATVWPFSCMSNLYNASAPRMYPRNCGHHNTEISLPPPSICCVDWQTSCPVPGLTSKWGLFHGDNVQKSISIGAAINVTLMMTHHWWACSEHTAMYYSCYISHVPQSRKLKDGLIGFQNARKCHDRVK